MMIVVRIWEGIGNQMFQYAYARMLKEKKGNTIFLEGRRLFREALPEEDLGVERKCGIYHFNISLKFIKPKYLSKWNYLGRKTFIQRIQYSLAQKGIGKYRFITDHENKFSFNQDLLNIRDNTYVMGHFFHRDYIEPIREILLREFTLKKPIIMSEWLKNVYANEDTVSLHIRRGDYLYVKCAQRINREMKKSNYYVRAMEYIANRVENPIFLIFSDDIEWVKENLKCSYRCIYVSDMGFEDYQELMLMSYCKHNIIANSTFSFWGGWLNQNSNKMVVAPKHWLPSIVPKEWIRI